ncbi:uncharacterized protein LOC113402249 [Vanessa tameamea]|uniref:Uncharacterized protein LOC113402249 n=1 Tax=Vanessa tameamea TaxID=334116 RepID=A0A8B8IM93_VANTA|nr:uncharacterized protein LOC113402249 [Vanessa tameamea]
MWRWLVVWQASLLLVSGTLDMRYLNSRYASSQFDCFDYPVAMPMRSFESGWGLARKPATEKYRSIPTPYVHELSRRIDFLLPNREDIVKEHAKLVQDINGLRQVMFVAPLANEPKDYEDSIFPEIIETSSTTTSRPSTTKPPRPTKGIPIVLLGGATRKHTIKSQPPKNHRQTLNLVGNSVTPLVRHPYPFITAASSRQPVRICMSSPFSYTSTTHRPSLWERLFKSIIPR